MGSLFQRASTAVLGVDVSPSSIKVVELARQRGGVPLLRQCAIEPLATGWVDADGGFDAFEAIAAALRRALKRSGSRARQAVLALPSAQVLTRRVVLPASLGGAVLAARVEAEASQSMPFPIEDASLDFYREGAPAEGRQTVWIAACRRDRVQDCAGLAEAASLDAVVVDVDSHAACRAALRAARTSGLAEHGSWMLVKVGARRTALHLLRGEELVHESEHAFGGNGLTRLLAGHYGFTQEEAEHKQRARDLPEDAGRTVVPQYHQILAGEIAQALEAVGAGTLGPGPVVLAGGGAAWAGLVEAVTLRVGRECRRVDPFVGMAIGPGVDRATLEAQSPSYLTACGLALRGLDT